MAARCWSTVHACFFFEPVQFDLQLPDLLIELGLELLGAPIRLLAAIGEELRQALSELPLPLGHQGGMDPVAGAQLRERLLLLQGFERYLGFELRTVVVSLCRHVRSLSLSDTAL